MRFCHAAARAIPLALALASSPSLGAEPATTPRASAAAPALTYTGKPFPPPGSPADQALLGSLLQAQAGVASERAIAVRTTQRLGADGVDRDLAALERSQAPGAAKHTGDVRARLLGAWGKVTEVMTARWAVDPRIGCRPEGIELEVLMLATPDSPAAAQLPLARSKARSCLDRQLLMLRPLERANRDLEDAAAETRALLTAAPGRADAGAGASASTGKP